MITRVTKAFQKSLTINRQNYINGILIHYQFKTDALKKKTRHVNCCSKAKNRQFHL